MLTVISAITGPDSQSLSFSAEPLACPLEARHVAVHLIVWVNIWVGVDKANAQGGAVNWLGLATSNVITPIRVETKPLAIHSRPLAENPARSTIFGKNFLNRMTVKNMSKRMGRRIKVARRRERPNAYAILFVVPKYSRKPSSEPNIMSSMKPHVPPIAMPMSTVDVDGSIRPNLSRIR